MAAPLLVHLVFHPASKVGRRLATALDAALNDDAAVPGLRIPTVTLPEDGSGLPPNVDLTALLDQAERSVVVVLADNEMANDVEDRDGRRGWGKLVGDLSAACGTKHRFAPVEVERGVWPLDEDDARLTGMNFYRGYSPKPPEWTEKEQTDLVTRQIVTAICRYLDSQASEGFGERAPVEIFVSHAKGDIDVKPEVFKAIASHLDATQPVRAWVDSGQIEGGDIFAEKLEKAVAGSCVLVLATRSYSSREWCRREVLYAKKYQRPLLVVNALERHDVRWFPYLGNAPLVTWTEGNAAEIVTLLLKECLRRQHAKLLLAQKQAKGDVLLTAPPELATVVAMKEEGEAFLYPDPPLGDEETALFASLGRTVQTPLQRAAKERSLVKLVVGLSLSEVDNPQRYGVTARALDAASDEITRHLLIQGAALAYGGHLGSAGYTLKLFDFVRAYRTVAGAPPIERVRHYYGWPLPLKAEDKNLYRKRAQLILVDPPADVADLASLFEPRDEYFGADSPERRFAWARGMTAMREKQTKEIAARVVIGGKCGEAMTAAVDKGKKRAWYSGRIPGVLEEAFLSVQAGQPVYIAGGFGGCGALVADALEGNVREELTWDFQKEAPHSEGMRKLYAERGVPFVDYDAIAKTFSTAGVAGVAAKNGLTEAENRELFRTRDPSRVVELVVRGLAKIASPQA